MDRRIRADDDVAHNRMHAIGAHHRVGSRARSILKAQRNLPAFLLEADEFLIEMDDLGRHRGGECIVQIGAVHA